MPSNIDSVINDIDDVKDDLRTVFRRKLRASMTALKAEVYQNIDDDADYSGNLKRSLSLDVERTPDGPKLTIGTNAAIAPYAPFVEFGTGSRTEQTFGASLPTYEPDSYPPNFPYESPAMSEGLVRNIVEWVQEKPVIPRDDSMTQKDLGFAIAATIVNKGTYAHPFMRPAWFQHELEIRQAAQNALGKVVR